MFYENENTVRKGLLPSRQVVGYTRYMNKNPINVYWSPYYIADRGNDWSFMYPKPETLMTNLLQNKTDDLDQASFFSCPAVSTKFKKMLVFKNSVACSYSYDATSEPFKIEPKTEQFIDTNMTRPQALKGGPSIEFGISNVFFADESLEAVVTPPFFHEPKYTQYGSIVPGEFDIGQWFRPVNFEVQLWKNKGEFALEDGEPIFYLELKTKRPVMLHRFNMTEKLLSYSNSNINYFNLFGRKVPLVNRYQRFREVGLREKILTEIRANLINEKPHKL